MAQQRWYKYPRTGWGTQLFEYLHTDKVQVINHARNGGSVMSFDRQNHFKHALQAVNENDIVIIGFAHNDQFHKPTDGQSALTVFEVLMTGFINKLKEKKAKAILSTPITRYTLTPDHGEFPQVIRTIAKSTNIGLIDFYNFSENLQHQLGSVKSKELYLIAESDQYIMHPKGIQDHIHLSPYGAQLFAKFAADTINQHI